MVYRKVEEVSSDHQACELEKAIEEDMLKMWCELRDQGSQGDSYPSLAYGLHRTKGGSSHTHRDDRNPVAGWQAVSNSDRWCSYYTLYQAPALVPCPTLY